MDIFLCAHTSKKVCSDITDLCEIEICAVPRSVQIGSFIYNHRIKNENIKREFVKRKKEIFRLYKSSSGKESLNIKSSVFRWVGLAVLGLIVAFYLFKIAFLDDAMAGMKDSEMKDIKKYERKNVVRKVEKELRYRRIKNVVTVGSEVSIVDPMTGELISISDLEYPIKIKRRKGRITVYGKYDPEEIDVGSSVKKVREIN